MNYKQLRLSLFKIKKRMINQFNRLVRLWIDKIGSLSIKELAIVGFSFVILPLFLSLLYSVYQINQLSKQGTAAIFDVAKVIQTNRELRISLNEMQRYASQYLVLKDGSLMDKFLFEEEKALTLLAKNCKRPEKSLLGKLSRELTLEIHETDKLLRIEFNAKLGELTLESLQQKFKKLNALSNQINDHTNQVISSQASNIRYFAEVVNNNMLQVLFIVPVTILIAALFIMLITTPLKQLKKHIQRLEKGDFEAKIKLKGSNEVSEVADALDMMRSRLYELELQKSSFIRHISHELKTPLAAIREGSELLYDNSVGILNKDQYEITSILKSSTEKLQSLIEDLLDFNVVLDATSLHQHEKLNFADLVNDAIEQRKLDINRKCLKIRRELHDANLFSNKKQLDVILDNLLSNAINYSPENGEIVLKNVKITNGVLFTISDQCCGIPESEHKKIFNAFYQAHNQKDNTIKSSGLGLTIVKELLTRLQGSIEVHSSTTLPSGTSMRITLLTVGEEYEKFA
jgi:two-component system sensor histidine kinase GlrK